MADLDAKRARSFGAIARDYDQLRPRTPRPAIDWLLPEHCADVVDLAAGTGALTDGLVGRDMNITAVEPDDRMRSLLHERLPSVTALAGRAEAIPLGDASADAVLVASAWHWFDAEAAYAEIGRVLRDGGVLGVLWNGRDRSVDWVAGLHAVMRRGRAGSRVPRHHVEPEPSAPFLLADKREFRWSRRMTPDELVGMLATYSGMIVATEAERRQRLATARRYVTTHPALSGRATIDVPHVTTCWRMIRERREP